MQKEGKAGSYIHSNVKAVKSWLSFNEIEIKNRIRIEGSQETPTLKDERVPTKEELKRILLAADTQQRVACILLAHSGLRPESLGNYEGDDGLKISDLPEIELHPRKHEVSFKKAPSIITVRPQLSKAGHQYFSFLSSEETQYLKEYLEKRMREGQAIDENSPILTSQKDSASKKVGAHITTTNVGDMIRSAIRKAGFRWRPYVLRSFFDTQLMIAESKRLILREHRTFFMGHKGDIENRYTTNKGKLPEEVIEDMRSSFKKASEYLLTMKTEGESSEEQLKKMLREQFLSVAGFKKEDIQKMDLSNLSDEDLNKLAREKLLGVMANNGNKQRVVPLAEVESFITQRV